jgi:hypothetical protein
LPLPAVHCEGQIVIVFGYAQLMVFVPSQLPAHIASLALHAVRAGIPPVTGGPVTGEHVPSLPVRLHA